jgi:fructokinase
MILCHGEMLIDFIPTEAPSGGLAYRPAVGGSPGNVALTLARLDVPSGFVGGLSNDFFGEQIVSMLAASGVSTSYLSRLDRPTMLAFVNLEGEEPRYAFYDAESAARNWRLTDMPPIGSEVSTLHFGSLSLIRHPAALEFAALMRREAPRRIISFDPNIRRSLVEDEQDYRERLREFFQTAHVIKLSEADLAWIDSQTPFDRLAETWLDAEARIVLLTRGAEGATIYGRSGNVSIAAFPVKVADTVGAGDATMGGLLAALDDRRLLTRERLDGIGEPVLAEVLKFALAVAAITCSRVGADPPRRTDLLPLLEKAGRRRARA